ncbi:MAG: diversity-generating retroelement protein Avd [Microcystis aeruginosa W13-11]|nr:diversity-generating retroelement protein Avd [Microcystis aeruginosa W13-11]
MNHDEKELSVIQKTYDLILWLNPILSRLPRNYRFTLGERIANNLYQLLEGLIEAKYSQEKEEILRSLNPKLSVLYYQIRLMVDLDIMSDKRYENLSRYLVEIGNELGGWLKSQTKIPPVNLTGTKNGR